jgi:hypothetical protein
LRVPAIVISLPCREEDQLEHPDLDLVARRELRLVDLLAVDVRAVQAPGVLDEERVAVAPFDRRVRARHGDVVQEDAAVRVASDRCRIRCQEERRPRVRATLDQKQSLSVLEFVMRERELILRLILGLDRGQGQRGVTL